jgi:hypothetical protein
LPHRIAFLITDLEPGGAERQMVELVSRLPRDAWSPTVLVLQAPPSQRAAEKVLYDAAVPVEYLHFRSKSRSLGLFTTLTCRFEALRPDVVQCFLFHANVAGAIAAHRAGIRRVVTGIRVAERRRKFHALGTRLTDKYVARHVCVSEAVAAFTRREVGLSASKLNVIPSGVVVARFGAASPMSPPEL